MATAAALVKKRLINISHLNEVLQVLRKCGYSGTSYYWLGLSLGLLAPTLDAIKANNVNNTAGCLLECLSAWLRQADNVDSTGGPTWETLIAALKSIDENSVADAIDREKQPSCAILLRHASTFTELIGDPILVAMAKLLCGEKIIEETILASVDSTGGSLPERIGVILTAVQEAVYADKQNLEKFAAILQQFTATVSVGHAILKDYRREFPDDSSVMVDKREISMTIHIPPSLNREFKRMRAKFGKSFYDVNQAMNDTPLSKEDLVKCLRFAYPHLQPRLTQCQDIDDVLQLISENCTLIDISLLEGVVDEFNIERAKPIIQQYKESIEDFCETIPVRLALNEKFSFPSPLQCQTVTFLVSHKVEECTLNDIDDLITHAFERLSPNVKVVVIREDNSFTITCSFPLVLTELLIASALKNVELLKKKGLLQLTIGYSTVYTSSTYDEVMKEISENKRTHVKKSVVSSDDTEWATAVYTSRGTLEQMIVSLSVQLVNEKDEHRVASLNERVDMLTEQLAALKESKSPQDNVRKSLKEKEEEIEKSRQALLKWVRAPGECSNKSTAGYIVEYKYDPIVNQLPDLAKNFSNASREIMSLLRSVDCELSLIQECDEQVRHISEVCDFFRNFKETEIAAYNYLEKVNDVLFKLAREIKKAVTVTDIVMFTEDLRKTINECLYRYKIFCECSGALVRSCNRAAAECDRRQQKEEEKKFVAQLAGGTLTAAIGVSGTVVSIVAGVFTMGIGTAIGLPLTAAAIVAAGATTAAVAHHFGKAAQSMRRIGKSFQRFERSIHDMEDTIEHINYSMPTSLQSHGCKILEHTERISQKAEAHYKTTSAEFHYFEKERITVNKKLYTVLFF